MYAFILYPHLTADENKKIGIYLSHIKVLNFMHLKFYYSKYTIWVILII